MDHLTLSAMPKCVWGRYGSSANCRTRGRVSCGQRHAQHDVVLCMSQLNLSARAYHRILKLARTIADLAGCEEIQSVHLAALTVCFAKALHAAQSFEVDAGIGALSDIGRKIHPGFLLRSLLGTPMGSPL